MIIGLEAATIKKARRLSAVKGISKIATERQSETFL
jgi:hypothetical protein